MSPNEDLLLARVEVRREVMAALTRELLQVPTVNPPGDAYEACARLLGGRLRRRGFEVHSLRAEGAPGDSETHPRIKVVARGGLSC